MNNHFDQISFAWIKITFWTNKLVKTCNKNNTSYVLGKDWNLLPLGSGIGRPQAAPSVCAFHFPWAINSHLFLKHMKYYYNTIGSRFVIHSFYAENMLPSTKMIQKRLKEKNIKVCINRLYKVLGDIDYKYKTVKENRKVFIERNEIRASRAHYKIII